jgi:hypothetical protein
VAVDDVEVGRGFEHTVAGDDAIVFEHFEEGGCMGCGVP